MGKTRLLASVGDPRQMVPQRVPTRQPGTIPRSQQTKEVVADSRLADAVIVASR